MVFQHAQNTDARHAAFNNVGRDQYNEYNFVCMGIHKFSS